MPITVVLVQTLVGERSDRSHLYVHSRNPLTAVHTTGLDSSEKVLISRGLVEDSGDWLPPTFD